MVRLTSLFSPSLVAFGIAAANQHFDGTAYYRRTIFLRSRLSTPADTRRWLSRSRVAKPASLNVVPVVAILVPSAVLMSRDAAPSAMFAKRMDAALLGRSVRASKSARRIPRSRNAQTADAVPRECSAGTTTAYTTATVTARPPAAVPERRLQTHPRFPPRLRTRRSPLRDHLWAR
ncbi:hypothetical protein EXIGLDRAFT_731058 [Exidia glandulosa HHB12029]|uniref:HIG1 domain-containing protein n=1 Tax=Exidia glandulosa HHB12029 TaxID=1314781 RepID=A0A165L4U9_EXIGL|nr:hypothetical protein EXIGLDRAFT_731058 [Exidia glandulosa HHB12029]